MVLFNKYKKIINNMITYGFVGGVSFLIEYSSFMFLYFTFKDKLIFSQITSYLISLAFNFIGNKYITFNSRVDNQKRSVKKQLLFYILLALFNVFFSTITIKFLVDIFDIKPLISKLITMFLIITWNYIIYKRLIFVSKK